MTFLILILLASFSALASEECTESREKSILSDFLKTDLERRIEKISNGLHEATINCSERIWPGYNLKGKEVILFSYDSKKAWSWKGNEKNSLLKEVEISTVSQHAAYSSYSVSTNPETYEMTLLINLDKKSEGRTVSRQSTGDSAQNLAAHEGFHFFEQFKMPQPWKTSTQDRLMEHPVSSEARFLRSELTKTLRAAFFTPNAIERTKKLIEAKAIWKRWKEDFPDEKEFTEALEIVEGSAMFAETMSSQLGRFGCNVSNQTLQEGMREYVAETYKENPHNFSLEIESYDLGLLSSLLLELEKSPDWKIQVENGVPPLQQLFENLPDTKYLKDEIAFQIKKKSIDQTNKELEDLISPSLKDFDSGDFIKVAIPGETFTNASGSHEGKFKLTQKDNLVITLNNSVERNFDGGMIKLNEVNTFHLNQVCSNREPSHVVLISKKEFDKKIKNNEINIDNASMQISGKGEFKDGVFCLAKGKMR